MTVTARRHPAEGPQRRPRGASACACTTWATSPSRRWPARSRPAPTAPVGGSAGHRRARSSASSWSPAPASCSAPPRTRPPTSSTWPASGWERSGSSPRSPSASSHSSCSRRASSRCRWDEVLGRFDEMTATGTTSTCTGSRTPTGCSPSATPVAALDLSNRFRAGGLVRRRLRPEHPLRRALAGANRIPVDHPADQPSGDGCSARAPTPISPTGSSVGERRVVFREMEYAVPRADGLDVLRECRDAIEAQTCGSVSPSNCGWHLPTTPALDCART